MKEILEYFPELIRKEFLCFDLDNLEEIRVRSNRPIYLKIGEDEIMTRHIVCSEEILEILQKICDNSIYTYQNQICSGYITIRGGHRIGITGNVVMKEGQVINISHIYSLNFRIARQVIGCSKTVLPYILNGNTIYNTLIISPPGRGKTTMVRDIIKNLSSGISDYHFQGITIGVVDERGEIGAMYRGVPQNDLGPRTDILDNISKDLGMKMLIRSMSPKVIVADEIGTEKDVEAIEYAICSGVKGIFTAHGSNIEDMKQSPILNKLLVQNMIDRILLIAEDRQVHLIYRKEKGKVA